VSRLREERGVALVSALLVTMIMLALGLGLDQYVRAQTSASGDERARESSFNLSDAVLDSTSNFLSIKWPSQSSAYPSSCTQASTGSSCPDANSVINGFTAAGYTAGTWSWSTEVHDNGAPNTSYYSDQSTSTRGQVGYDANGDGVVWIRAQAVVRGRKETVVAQAKIQQVRNTFPKNAVTAQYFGTGNNGKKVLVDTVGDPPGVAGAIAVRCTNNQALPNSCLNYSPSKGQVFPDTRQMGVTGTDPAMSVSDLALTKQRAQSLGTYYTSCPSSMTGPLVYVELATAGGTCTYNASVTYNSDSGTSPGPGFFILANGNLVLGGRVTYYGLIYLPNLQNSTGNVFSSNGNALVVGGIAVDKGGGVLLGNAGMGLQYDSNVFNLVTANGSVTVVQNTWRQI
jgi:Tfp pilus assembly protein PilX